MATLRLFAAAREAAGTTRAEIEGASVGAVLAQAEALYGPAFAAVVRQSRIWCNGQPAGSEDPVSAADEVAVLPPVSGGS